jgi:hypothetical protein
LQVCTDHKFFLSPLSVRLWEMLGCSTCMWVVSLATIHISLRAYMLVIKVISIVSFTPHPLFQWYPQGKEILLALPCKAGTLCWESL